MERVRVVTRRQRIAGAVVVVSVLLSLVWMGFRGPIRSERPDRVGSGAGRSAMPDACLKLAGKRPSPAADELVLGGGTVITMDPAGTRATGVAMRDGRIDDVLSSDAAPDSPATVDLEGATVLPGFIDSHGHWIGDRELVRQWASQAIDAALAQGWTSISELFVTEQRLSDLCALEKGDDLRVKVGAFLPVNYEFQRFGRWYEYFEPGQVLGPHLFLQGIKIFADRAADGLGYQTDPPDPAVQGTLFWEPGELAAEIENAHDAGWQIAIHATGDGGLDLVLDGFAGLGRGAIVGSRHRVEHLTTVRDDQVDRIADLGLIASVQHSWFHADAVPDLVRWLGRERVALTGRWRDLLDAGIPLTGSTDRPWALVGQSGDSMNAIGFAVSRRSPSGETPPAWMAAQRLTVDEVLRSITIDAAFAQGTEESVGSIEPGKAADLVVLSADPTGIWPGNLRKIDVLATIVDGRVEYCGRAAPDDLRPFCPASE